MLTFGEQVWLRYEYATHILDVTNMLTKYKHNVSGTGSWKVYHAAACCTRFILIYKLYLSYVVNSNNSYHVEFTI